MLKALVVEQTQLSPDLFELWLDNQALYDALPGQFLMIRCEGQTLLRRPFSTCRLRNTSEVSVLYRVVGEGTRWLTSLKPGDELDFTGPFGRSFDPPAPSDRLMLIGGGVGVAPLAVYAKHYSEYKKQLISARMGFADSQYVAGVEPFISAGMPLDVFTDNGTFGSCGRITTGLEDYLTTHQINRVLCCGPDPMMEAVSDLCQKLDIPCEVSVERMMGCGIGLCLGCVVEMKDGQYLRSCTEGPVFKAKEIQWT
jgi:dihydroorotate dehydrogenase electron transfer subunit